MKPIALYLHIPFCRRKCLYCDFCSFPGNQTFYHSYLEALKQELRQRWNPEWEVATIYIGGGTPTVLPPDTLTGLLEEVKSVAAVRPDAEVTIEANPGTVDAAALAQLLAAGFNRLSLGAQSGHDRFLKTIGRTHTVAQVEAVMATARSAGFNNISLDLIYGLPGETLDSWRQTLEWAMALQPDHLSCYGLQVEEGTPLAKMVREGKIRLPGEDEVSAMFLENTKVLPAAGYQQYEISNFARQPRTGVVMSADFRCRHNLFYWKYADYLGLGVAAVSTMAGRRRANRTNLQDYITAVNRGTQPPAVEEELTREEQMAEMLMLGFRLNEGPDAEAFQRRWGVSLNTTIGDRVAPFLAGGFLRKDGETYALTAQGMLVSNQVLAQLLSSLL